MKNTITIIFIISLSACAQLYPTNESRISGYKERCSLMGYTQGTKANSSCVLELEKSYEEGKASRSSSGSNGGMSFLCKDAISRGDSGAINVHCN